MVEKMGNFTAKLCNERRVLIAEDDEDSAYTLVMQLSLLGYSHVKVTQDGESAIDYLQKNTADLVLLDLMMPNCDGFGVLEWIRSRGDAADVPVIVISALDTPEAIVRSIKLGAFDFLPKPIRSDMLRARINASLERRLPPQARALQVRVDSDPTLVQQTLDSLRVGAIVVEAGGRILAANSRAAALFADGLCQANGYVKAEDPESQRALLDLIDSVLQGHASSKAIALRRPSRRMPMLVRARAAIGRVEPSCVLLLIADPETGHPPQVMEELTLLGLTPGESRIAALVGCGHSPRDAAVKLGIAEETARTVLKRVYEKLQIRRQGELATFVSQIALISDRRSES